MDGAIKAICSKLVSTDVKNSRTSKDLSEQCVKVLEHLCSREATAVFEAGALECVLQFIKENGSFVHRDTLLSGMSVVSRLCAKVEPADNSNLAACVESLSALLEHDDSFVSDEALRCFASLADRFARRTIDPAPLAEKNLIDQLLTKMIAVSKQSQPVSMATIISLLSTLCRGSPSVAHDLLRSRLPEALEAALKCPDDRSVLDAMRLVDLLLVLIFEGRVALPKATGCTPSAASRGSCTERTHRQLIDCIRSKDTDALIEAIENGSVDVNFMDDVGQTLLNWASAFGTQEMVEFLCERGGDVNKGQRSSSLHYAACFGRPEIAKVLLRHGANPDLRDEDGKTPLDKARERNDQGHREVSAILQSPGEYMCTNMGVNSALDSLETTGQDEPQEPQGDLAVAPVFLKALIPVLCQIEQHSLVKSVQRSALNLLRKMLHYIDSALFTEMSSTDLAPMLAGVISQVIDAEEEDQDTLLIALQMVKDILSKSRGTYIEYFSRLGVISKIEILSLSAHNPEAECSMQDNIDSSSSESPDATEVVAGKIYHWKDWSIVRGRDCLYLWNDSAALELSNGSNGWFRFILDNKLQTMYSSGSPEGGADSSENRGEFVEKLQRARSQCKLNQPSQSILTHPKTSKTKLVVGNWSLSGRSSQELVIHNSDGQQQATVLKEDLPGFIFESNRGTKHTFTAETLLGELKLIDLRAVPFSAECSGRF